MAWRKRRRRQQPAPILFAPLAFYPVLYSSSMSPFLPKRKLLYLSVHPIYETFLGLVRCVAGSSPSSRPLLRSYLPTSLFYLVHSPFRACPSLRAFSIVQPLPHGWQHRLLPTLHCSTFSYLQHLCLGRATPVPNSTIPHTVARIWTVVFLCGHMIQLLLCLEDKQNFGRGVGWRGWFGFGARRAACRFGARRVCVAALRHARTELYIP